MNELLKTAIQLLGKRKLVQYILLGILSGLCSFLFINSVTRVIGLIISGSVASVRKEYIIAFLLIILLVIWIRRTLALGLINLSQRTLWKLRKQILSLILDANYQQLISRRPQVMPAIMNDVNTILDASLGIIDFCTSLIVAVCCLAYLLSLSWILFLITIVISAIGITVYQLNAKRNLQLFMKVRQLETKFQGDLFAIVDGFKEVFMEPKKGRYIFNHRVTQVANESYQGNVSAFTGFLNNQITGQILFYILISSVLLVFSEALNIKTNNAISFVFTLLYLLGAIEMVMVILPRMARAKIASKNLIKLKTDLEESNFSNPLPKRYILKNEFNQLTIRNLEFYYGKDEKSFGVGPIDFDLQKGEIAFIYGGNGSGKTTFVFSILGLCYPSAGEVKFNDILVTSENYTEYRTMFSVVFSNFYLFDEIIGVNNFDLERWNYYLRLFEIEDKVKLEGMKLSTTDLSTGQRKRLALILTLLEDKPILVMDEWAADQDPVFRKKFYIEILPLLKEEGFTIIAITHDDKYYPCADKVYKMNYGKLSEEQIAVFQH
jgi:putative ATP-binding cassette transporter